MANIKKPKSKPIDKGMATRAGAKALEVANRLKAYNKATQKSEAAYQHMLAVAASHKKKPDSSGKKRVLKAKSAFFDAVDRDTDIYTDYFMLKDLDTFKKYTTGVGPRKKRK